MMCLIYEMPQDTLCTQWMVKNSKTFTQTKFKSSPKDLIELVLLHNLQLTELQTLIRQPQPPQLSDKFKNTTNPKYRNSYGMAKQKCMKQTSCLDLYQCLIKVNKTCFYIFKQKRKRLDNYKRNKRPERKAIVRTIISLCM